VPITKPNQDRASVLESEITKKEKELEEAKAEAEKYSGGLIAAMKEATVATIEQTLAMLKQEYLRSKYGLALPSISSGETTVGKKPPSPKTSTSITVEDPSMQIILPIVSNKRYAEDKYEEYIWFDIEWKAVNLRKPARSIKGLLLFHDLFEEQKFGIRVTLNEPLSPGESLFRKGMGFEYNQFLDEHKWVRTTELNDMLIYFKVQSILYTDGEREDF